MYSLNVIKKLNRKDPVTPESETSRHCSYTHKKGENECVVLHSAKRRSTLALQGRANVKEFLLKVLSTNSVDRVDTFIESYFADRERKPGQA